MNEYFNEMLKNKNKNENNLNEHSYLCIKCYKLNLSANPICNGCLNNNNNRNKDRKFIANVVNLNEINKKIEYINLIESSSDEENDNNNDLNTIRNNKKIINNNNYHNKTTDSIYNNQKINKKDTNKCTLSENIINLDKLKIKKNQNDTKKLSINTNIYKTICINNSKNELQDIIHNPFSNKFNKNGKENKSVSINNKLVLKNNFESNQVYIIKFNLLLQKKEQLLIHIKNNKKYPILSNYNIYSRKKNNNNNNNNKTSLENNKSLLLNQTNNVNDHIKQILDLKRKKDNENNINKINREKSSDKKKVRRITNEIVLESKNKYKEETRQAIQKVKDIINIYNNKVNKSSIKVNFNDLNDNNKVLKENSQINDTFETNLLHPIDLTLTDDSDNEMDEENNQNSNHCNYDKNNSSECNHKKSIDKCLCIICEKKDFVNRMIQCQRCDSYYHFKCHISFINNDADYSDEENDINNDNNNNNIIFIDSDSELETESETDSNNRSNETYCTCMYCQMDNDLIDNSELTYENTEQVKEIFNPLSEIRNINIDSVNDEKQSTNESGKNINDIKDCNIISFNILQPKYSKETCLKENDKVDNKISQESMLSMPSSHHDNNINLSTKRIIANQWQKFFGYGNEEFEKQYEETTRKINEELQCESLKKNYTKGFTSKGELDNQLNKLCHTYSLLEEKLKIEDAEKLKQTTTFPSTNNDISKL